MQSLCLFIPVRRIIVNEENSGVTAILLICREGASREAYQTNFAAYGVLLVCVQSFMQFFRKEVYCPLSGIFVDMPTYMRSSEEEKQLLTEVVAIFPSLRLKCNENTGEIRTLPFGKVYQGDNTPLNFIQNNCKSFAPRKVRTSVRTNINLPALLNKSAALQGLTSQKSVTANISSGGCFLINFEPWDIHQNGTIVLNNLKESTPIKMEIRSIRQWGEYNTLPGMGIKFIDLTKLQQLELSRLGGQSFMQD